MEISNTTMIRKWLGGRMPFTLVEIASGTSGSLPLPLRILADLAQR
jgi:hypothetical protein